MQTCITTSTCKITSFSLIRTYLLLSPKHSTYISIMVSTCGDSEYLAELDDLVIGDGYMRTPEKGFQLALKVELDRERVAKWAKEVVIGIEVSVITGFRVRADAIGRVWCRFR